MYSEYGNPVLQQSSVFHWLISILEEHKPIFLAILKVCNVSKDERHNRSKESTMSSYTKSYIVADYGNEVELRKKNSSVTVVIHIATMKMPL